MGLTPFWHDEPEVLKKVIMHALKTVKEGKKVEDLEARIELIDRQSENPHTKHFPRTIAECLSLPNHNKVWLRMLSGTQDSTWWNQDAYEVSPVLDSVTRAPILALFKVLPWIQSTQDLGLHSYINELGVAVKLGNQSRVASLKIIDKLRKQLREREDELVVLKAKLKQYEEIVKFRNDPEAMKKWKQEETATRHNWDSCVVNPYLTG